MAERETRMRVEAAAAAEQARHQGELERTRLAHEVELRRAEVAKTRPTWMLAVTGIAVALGLGLAWFAVDRSNRADAAEEATARAAEQTRQAKAESAAAGARVTAMQGELDELDGKVEQAQHALAAAETAAQRQQAKALLDAANRKAQLAHEAWLKAKQLQEEIERKRGITTDNCGRNSVICRQH